MLVAQLSMRMPASFLPFGSQTGSQTTEVQALTGECPLPRVKGMELSSDGYEIWHPGAGMPGLLVRDVVAHLCAVCRMCWPGG